MPTVMAGKSLGGDGNAQLSMDLGMQPHRDSVLSHGLDGVFQLDPALVHRVSLTRQSIGNVLRGDGPEQLAFLACLPGQVQLDRPQCAGNALRLVALCLVSRGAGTALSGNSLLVPLSCLERQTLGK